MNVQHTGVYIAAPSLALYLNPPTLSARIIYEVNSITGSHGRVYGDDEIHPREHVHVQVNVS